MVVEVKKRRKKKKQKLGNVCAIISPLCFSSARCSDTKRRPVYVNESLRLNRKTHQTRKKTYWWKFKKIFCRNTETLIQQSFFWWHYSGNMLHHPLISNWNNVQKVSEKGCKDYWRHSLKESQSRNPQIFWVEPIKV